MDLHAKQLLLNRVIEYAQKFQIQKRRKNLKAVDIHDALHALGLRPLFADLHVTGDEAVCPSDLFADSLTVSASNVILRIQVDDSREWEPSTENFRKRRWPNKAQTTFDLPEKTRHYVEHVVASCHGALTSMTPPSDRDLLIASWFLGLHFSSTVDKASSPIDWKFIRNAIWVLESAKAVYAKIATNKNITNSLAADFIWAPWLSGLSAIANSSVALSCVSEGQVSLIRSVCARLI